MSELFDLSEQYSEMLCQGIRLSGEDQDFFIAGRVRHLRCRLPDGWEPRRILDFGCGNGRTAGHLAGMFPAASIVGVDTAAKALDWAEARCGSSRISFRPLACLANDSFDLCYTNGVFHHIDPGERLQALRTIYDALMPGGYLAIFENNPWNPGTRMVMARIPFDRDAKPLPPIETPRLMRQAGFEVRQPTRFLFYFPRPLAFLRFTEPGLSRVPLGAQYCALGRKVAHDLD